MPQEKVKAAVCPDGYYWDATRQTEGGLPGACVRSNLPATDEFNSGVRGNVDTTLTGPREIHTELTGPTTVNSVSLPNFLGSGVNSVSSLFLRIIDFLMLLLLPLATLMLIWAGFQFVTAQGSEEKLTKAKKNLLWTVIGVAVVLASRAIISYVSEVLGGGTGQTSALMRIFRNLVNQIIYVLFALVTVYFFWGVAEFVRGSGSGDSKAVEEGKRHMIWGIIGMAVMLGAWGIVGAIQAMFR